MRTNSRLRFLAWLCVVAVLLTAASAAAAGAPPAILAPAGTILCELSPGSVIHGAEEIRSPDRLVLRGVAARAPPLA